MVSELFDYFRYVSNGFSRQSICNARNMKKHSEQVCGLLSLCAGNAAAHVRSVISIFFGLPSNLSLWVSCHFHIFVAINNSAHTVFVCLHCSVFGTYPFWADTANSRKYQWTRVWYKYGKVIRREHSVPFTAGNVNYEPNRFRNKVKLSREKVFANDKFTGYYASTPFNSVGNMKKCLARKVLPSNLFMPSRLYLQRHPGIPEIM